MAGELFLLLSTCALALGVDICGDYPSPDPCRPGGLWDPVLNSCSGYMQEPCFQCFSGQRCETRENPADCQLIAQSGNPLVVAEYWLNRTADEEPCTTTIAHYRSAYQQAEDRSAVDSAFLLPPLTEAIHQLHNATGNADSTGYHVVGAFGATMVLHSLILTLSQQILAACTSDCPSQVDVFVQRPYYLGYPSLVELSPLARWSPDADPSSPFTIEIVTHPNNPSGELREPLVKDPDRVVWDMVYYWPMFTNEVVKMRKPIMVFSSSKHDGLAGTRFGWALLQSSVVAEGVSDTIGALTAGLSVDVELRVLTSLQAILSEPRTPSGFLPFHQFSRLLMAERFKQLSSMLTCANITNYPSSSTGAYAWVKCQDGVSDCSAFFKTVNVLVLPGPLFGASAQYARITMLLPSVEFDILLSKVKALNETVLPTHPSHSHPSSLHSSYSVIPSLYVPSHVSMATPCPTDTDPSAHSHREMRLVLAIAISVPATALVSAAVTLMSVGLFLYCKKTKSKNFKRLEPTVYFEEEESKE